MNKLPLLLFTLSLVACAPAPRQDVREEGAFDELFAELDEGHRPGAAVLVSQGGKTLYEGYFGQAQLEYEVPIGAQTRFNAGSIAKQIVGYLVLRLAEEGRLDLAAPVQDYLPDMPEFEKPITVRQLLHHTNGLRDAFDLLVMAGSRRDDVITDRGLRRVLRRQRTLNHAPGEEFSYTNSGYILLAEIIETVTDQRLAEFAEARVFEPLGMAHSFFARSHEAVIPDFAYSFEQRDGAWHHSRLNSSAAGAGDLISTARDLDRWLRYLLTLRREGDAIWERMLDPAQLANGELVLNARGELYAAGVFIGGYRGQRYIGHGGGVAGYRAAAYLFPDHELAVVVLMNGPWQPAQNLVLGLAEAVLKRKGVALKEEKTVEVYDGEVDRDLIRAAQGLYVAPQPAHSANLPEHIGIALLERDEGLAVAVLGEPMEIAQPLSATEFRTSQWSHLQLRLQGAEDGGEVRVEANLGGGYVPLRPAGCDLDEPELRSLAGRYRSPELRSDYTLAVSDDRLYVNHARHGSGWLLCLARDLFVPVAVPDERSWSFTVVEVVHDKAGKVEGLYLSYGERTRRVFFAAVED